MCRNQAGARELVHREKSIRRSGCNAKLSQACHRTMRHAHAIAQHDDDVLDTMFIVTTMPVISVSTIFVTQPEIIEVNDSELRRDAYRAGRVGKSGSNCVNAFPEV